MLRAAAGAQVGGLALPRVRCPLAQAGVLSEAAWADGAGCDAGSCGIGRAAWAVHLVQETVLRPGPSTALKNIFSVFPSAPAARRGRPRDTDTDAVTMHMQVHVELAVVNVFEAEIVVLWLRYDDCSW